MAMNEIQRTRAIAKQRNVLYRLVARSLFPARLGVVVDEHAEVNPVDGGAIVSCHVFIPLGALPLTDQEKTDAANAASDVRTTP